MEISLTAKFKTKQLFMGLELRYWGKHILIAIALLVIILQSRAICADDTVLRIAVVHNSYEFSCPDSTNCTSCITSITLAEIEKSAGIKFEIIHLDKFDNVFGMLNNNEIEMACCFSEHLPDGETFITSDSIITIPYYCFIKQENKAINGIPSLINTNYRTGIIKGCVLEKSFDLAASEYNIIKLASIDACINSLLCDEIDCFMAPGGLTYTRIIDLKQTKRIKISEKDIAKIQLKILLPKTSTKLKERLDNAIAVFKKSDKYSEIQSRHQNITASYYNNQAIVIYSLLGFLVSAVLLLIYKKQKIKIDGLIAKYEHLNNILETTECIILVLRTDYSIKYANSYALRLFGYEFKELHNKNALEILVPEIDSEGKPCRDLLYQCLGQRINNIPNTNENITKYGQRLFITWSNKKLINNTTGETEIISFGIDISERINIENEIKLIQTEREAILDNMAGGVLFLSKDLDIVSVNKEMENITGKKAEELIGKKCYNYICERDHDCPHCAPKVAMKTGKRYNSEKYVNIKNHDFEVISSPIYNAFGEINGTISILTDVTRRKQLHDNLKAAHQAMEYYTKKLENQVQDGKQKLVEQEESLKSAQHQLIQAEKMASLGRLIAGIGHEINTPLGAIRSSGEIIENAMSTYLEKTETLGLWLNSNEKDYFYNLIELAMTNNSLELSSKENRRIKHYIAEQLEEIGIADNTNLIQLLAEIGMHDDLAQHEHFIKNKSTDERLKIIQDISQIVSGAKIISWSVEKAHNIVSALKNFIYTNDKTTEKKLTNIKDSIKMILVMYSNQTKHGVEVELELDNIPEIKCYQDELNQVWSNLINNALQAMDFHGKLTISGQADSDKVTISIRDTGCGIPEEIKGMIFRPLFTTKDQGEGTGLGLDIVKQIIEKNNGNITVESKVGEGSCFNVTLPIGTHKDNQETE